jgi:hypothetical protein
MTLTEHYKNNRPLLYSILTGLFYFLFCLSLDFGDGTKVLFMTLMIFLPGLTFPLATCYYKTSDHSYSVIQKVSHLLLSVAIYHGSVWIFSGEGQIKYITVPAGFVGSLTFLLVIKYILNKNISLIQILLASIFSGLTFLQYELGGRQGLLMGISVFLWTIINGLTLNFEYRKTTYR